MPRKGSGVSLYTYVEGAISLTLALTCPPARIGFAPALFLLHLDHSCCLTVVSPTRLQPYIERSPFARVCGVIATYKQLLFDAWIFSRGSIFVAPTRSRRQCRRTGGCGCLQAPARSTPQLASMSRPQRRTRRGIVSKSSSVQGHVEAPFEGNYQ